jgi:hypothetical protein
MLRCRPQSYARILKSLPHDNCLESTVADRVLSVLYRTSRRDTLRYSARMLRRPEQLAKEITGNPMVKSSMLTEDEF